MIDLGWDIDPPIIANILPRHNNLPNGLSVSSGAPLMADNPHWVIPQRLASPVHVGLSLMGTGHRGLRLVLEKISEDFHLTHNRDRDVFLEKLVSSQSR